MRRFPTLLAFGLLNGLLSPISVAGGFEDDCRTCHASGVPDRHHELYGRVTAPDSVAPYPDANGDGFPDATYGCLSCHGATMEVVRNCIACHATPVGTVPDGTHPAERPLTVTTTDPGGLTLEWDASCGLGDTDYIVYEGSLGDFASHSPIRCTTAGNTWANFEPPAGSAYFLIVPRNHWSEGSYGVDSSRNQRSPSAAACLSQTLGCPWFSEAKQESHKRYIGPIP